MKDTNDLASTRSGGSRLHADNLRVLLLSLLLADPDTAMRAADQVTRGGHWQPVFHLSQVWSIVPQLAERIRSLGLMPEREHYDSFRRLLIETYARSASRASRGANALCHLAEAGVPALAFKGLASMARLYRPQPNRTIKDADLLVAPADVPAAIEQLAEIGYTPLEGHELERLEKFLANSPGFSGNRAIVLSDDTGFEIDLHWSVGIAELPPAALLARCETVPLLGGALPIVSAADGLILTARHSVRENLSVDMICRDLFDIALCCAYSQRNGTLDAVLDHASGLGSRVPLLALAGALCELDKTDAAIAQACRHLAAGATAAEARGAGQLQRLFFFQVAGRPIDKDLLYLFHTRPLHQIARGALANWTEYRELMQSMEEKLDGEKIPLRRRLRRLAATVRGLGPGSLASLRTLAQLKHGG